MKERPINLTAQEVKDALDVSHMTLRRLVKPQPPERFLSGDVAGITNGKRWAFSRIRGSFKEAWPEDPTPGFWCPLGQTGERLWGREKHYIGGGNRVRYEASLDVLRVEDGTFEQAIGGMPAKWRPPVRMPRWASRILLEIEHVRLDLSDGQWWWVIKTKRIEVKK